MKRTLVVLAVALTLVLAGCGGSGDTTATPTGGDGGEANSAAASDLRRSVVDSLGSVDVYRVTMNQSTSLRGPVDRNQSIDRTTLVDRPDRRFRRSVTITRAGRTLRSTAILADRTLHIRSEANRRRFSSEWVKYEIPENFSQYWELQDRLSQLRPILTNASSTSVAGTDTVQGTEVRVLEVTVEPSAYADILQGGQDGGKSNVNVTVDRASFEFYVEPDSGRPIRVQSDVAYSQEVDGRTGRFDVSTTYTFEYGVDASFEVPEAARNAPNASEGRGGGRPRVTAATAGP